MDFDEFRTYVYGDDIKHIDWKVTARSTQPHIRLFREERDLCIALCIDVSHSMLFGSQTGAEKITKAAEIALYFITLAAMHQDRSQIFFCAEDIIAHTPPRRSEIHAHRLLMHLLEGTFSQTTRHTQLETCFTQIHQRLKQRSVCIIISDFYDDTPYKKPLRALAQKHHVHVLHIRDPKELSPPAGWFFSFRDPESKQKFKHDSSSHPMDCDELERSKVPLTHITTQSCPLDVLSAVTHQTPHTFKRYG